MEKYKLLCIKGTLLNLTVGKYYHLISIVDDNGDLYIQTITDRGITGEFFPKRFKGGKLFCFIKKQKESIFS
jgi:hypothetical protein